MMRSNAECACVDESALVAGCVTSLHTTALRMTALHIEQAGFVAKLFSPGTTWWEVVSPTAHKYTSAHQNIITRIFVGKDA